MVDRLNCDMMDDVLKRGYLERNENEDTGRDWSKAGWRDENIRETGRE